MVAGNAVGGCEAGAHQVGPGRGSQGFLFREVPNRPATQSSLFKRQTQEGAGGRVSDDALDKTRPTDLVEVWTCTEGRRVPKRTPRSTSAGEPGPPAA